MRWNRNMGLVVIAAGLLGGCSNDSMKIVRYLEKTELSECENLDLEEPVHVGDQYFAMERRGTFICAFDSRHKLTEAYKLVSQEKAAHVFTSESSEWSLGTKHTFGPYNQPKN